MLPINEKLTKNQRKIAINSKIKAILVVAPIGSDYCIFYPPQCSSSLFFQADPKREWQE